MQQLNLTRKIFDEEINTPADVLTIYDDLDIMLDVFITKGEKRTKLETANVIHTVGFLKKLLYSVQQECQNI